MGLIFFFLKNIGETGLQGVFDCFPLLNGMEWKMGREMRMIPKT
jgi:hypothetical protein